MKRIIGALCLLAVLCGSAYGKEATPAAAGETPSQQGRATREEAARSDRRPGPPPEAFKACEGKAEGSAASFTNPEGETIAGTCRFADGKLVLRPDHPRKDGADDHHGPPPEAYQACEGKSAGSQSQFVDPRGETVRGTCEDEDGKMVLRPEHRRNNKPGEANNRAKEGRDTR